MSKTELPTEYDVIEPHSGWCFLNVREIWDYRDLVYFLFWRDVKARYAQSVLGFGWAFVQPIFMMIVQPVIYPGYPMALQIMTVTAVRIV